MAHVPPARFGFRHVGTEVWLRPHKPMRVCATDAEDPNCSNSVVTIKAGLSLADHAGMLGYNTMSGALKKCAPGF